MTSSGDQYIRDVIFDSFRDSIVKEYSWIASDIDRLESLKLLHQFTSNMLARRNFDYIHNRYNRSYGILTCGFSWNKSPENGEFWSVICTNYPWGGRSNYG